MLNRRDSARERYFGQLGEAENVRENEADEEDGRKLERLHVDRVGHVPSPISVCCIMRTFLHAWQQ